MTTKPMKSTKPPITNPEEARRAIPVEARRLHTRVLRLRQILAAEERKIQIAGGQGSGDPDDLINIDAFTFARNRNTEHLQVAHVLSILERSEDFQKHDAALTEIREAFAAREAAEAERQRLAGAAKRELIAVREAAEARAAAVVEQDPEVRAAAERLAALQKPIQP
jgi:hypothetical protein